MTDKNPPSSCSSPKLPEYLEDCDTSSPSRSEEPSGGGKEKALNYINSKLLKDQEDGKSSAVSTFPIIVKFSKSTALPGKSSKPLSNSDKCALPQFSISIKRFKGSEDGASSSPDNSSKPIGNSEKCASPPFLSNTEPFRGSKDSALSLLENSSKLISNAEKCASSFRDSKDSALSLLDHSSKSINSLEKSTSTQSFGSTEPIRGPKGSALSLSDKTSKLISNSEKCNSSQSFSSTESTRGPKGSALSLSDKTSKLINNSEKCTSSQSFNSTESIRGPKNSALSLPDNFSKTFRNLEKSALFSRGSKDDLFLSYNSSKQLSNLEKNASPHSFYSTEPSRRSKDSALSLLDKSSKLFRNSKKSASPSKGSTNNKKLEFFISTDSIKDPKGSTLSLPDSPTKTFNNSEKHASLPFFKTTETLGGSEDSALFLFDRSSKPLSNSEKRASPSNFIIEPVGGPEDSGLPCNSDSVNFSDSASLNFRPEPLRNSKDRAPLPPLDKPRSPGGEEQGRSPPCKCRELISTPMACSSDLLRSSEDSILCESTCCNNSPGRPNDCCSSTPCDVTHVCCVERPCGKQKEKKSRLSRCPCAKKCKIWNKYLMDRRKISMKIMKKTGKTYCNLLLNKINTDRPEHVVEDQAQCQDIWKYKLDTCPGTPTCENFCRTERPQIQCVNFPRKRCAQKNCKRAAKRLCFKEKDDQNVSNLCSKQCSQLPKEINNFSCYSCIQNLDCDGKNFIEYICKFYQNLNECNKRVARSYIVKFLSDVLFAQCSGH